MQKPALKDILYGGLQELMKNDDYFYRSSLGTKFNKWEPEGVKAVMELVNLVSGLMHDIEQEDLDQRAKEITLRELSK